MNRGPASAWTRPVDISRLPTSRRDGGRRRLLDALGLSLRISTLLRAVDGDATPEIQRHADRHRHNDSRYLAMPAQHGDTWLKAGAIFRQVGAISSYIEAISLDTGAIWMNSGATLRDIRAIRREMRATSRNIGTRFQGYRARWISMGAMSPEFGTISRSSGATEGDIGTIL